MKKASTTKRATHHSDTNNNGGLNERIAHRAYALWHQRGCEHGNDLADWFQAEIEVNELYGEEATDRHRKQSRRTSSNPTARRILA